MLMRKVAIICLMLIIGASGFLSAQSRETLAVLDFKTEAVSEIEMSAIVEFLSAELFKTNKYIVMSHGHTYTHHGCIKYARMMMQYGYNIFL